MSEMNPDWISPPGDTILAIMNEAKMSFEALAEQLGMTDDELNRLLRGVTPITRPLANKLENTIGAPASFWMDREQRYRDELHKLATSKPEIIIRETEVQRLNMKPGEVLVVKLRDCSDMSMKDMDSLKKGFQSLFPANKVILLALPQGSSLDLTIAQGSEYPEPVAAGCSTSPVSYCGDCGCGKKERVEKQLKGK